ncbi:hypothetical protein KI688_001479 [Linnemannia hyalina]|uniref:FHF complex subunit HOOK-interacting protein C-terminal domain-containing protein n=1 Tax=Linnemannia hyalina TaxID=64524 RepID=A0A9P7XT98_9FUNG|nr:hypothetical protein KI688_001479 [Linnemannia hyalina]
MDSSFWNKLKKTIMTAPRTEPSSAMQKGFSTPEKRSLYVQQTEIPMRLKSMVDLLVDEESRLDEDSAMGVCMEYLVNNSVLTKLVNNAEGDEPKGIMGETIRTIASMINLLDDRFLVHKAVHTPTVKLLRTCAQGSEFDGESYHEDLIDLMYILCSKIHGYPELLNIFFHDKLWLTVPQRGTAKRLQKTMETMELLKTIKTATADAANDAAAAQRSLDTSAGQDSATQDSVSSDAPNKDNSTIPQTVPQPKSDYEFLLFSYLSRFVHLEGKAGDFARTGLLFLMELATGSLGEYIMELGFTSFLSAGVGASYSQLPRKLLVRGGPNNINSMVGTLNDRAPPAETTQSNRVNIEISTSPDFQSRLDAFLKLLEFCQDIMMRCPSSDIVAALLVSFKSVFLENILYPSILECSDTDGSSVAVISYIDLILQVLEHEALVDLVVGFLMASDDEQSNVKTSAATDDAFAEIQNPQGTSPYFMAHGRFTLKDLILSRLKSRSQPTVIATLKLLNTVITRHCKYSLKLLSIQPDSKATSFRESPDQSNSMDAELTMISHHVHELDLFYALISTINPHNTAEIFCNGYESYLRDAEGTVETHQCFLQRKESSEAKPGQPSALEQKKQRRRSMKYGQKMDLPDELSGDAFIREQEKTTEAMGALTCCDKVHPVPMHRLQPSDPLLQILLGTLYHYFSHSVELNLALTGVITSLAVCPYRSLEGWLLFKSSDIKKSADEEGTNPQSDVRFQLGDSDDEDSLPAYLTRSANGKSGKTASPVPATNADASESPAFKSFPPFFTMLKTLTQQVDYYRSEIDGFDEYLADRRRGLLVATELNSAIHTPGLANDRRRAPQHQHQQYSQQYQQPQSQQYPQQYQQYQQPQQYHSGPQASYDPRHQHAPSMAASMSPGPMGSTPRTPVAGARPPTLMIPSPKARKSSSPSSLMSSPSNMSFLSPTTGISKRPFGKNATPVASGASDGNGGPLAPALEAEVNVSSPTSPVVVYPPRGSSIVAGSLPLYTNSNYSTSMGARSTGPAGMAGPAGTQPSSWGSYGTQANHTPNPMLLRTMDTMLIKPLFSDGFINDSDSETDGETGRSEMSEEEDSVEGSVGRSDEAGDAPKTPKPSRRTREASSSTTASGEIPSSGRREKTVTLGQLLTNVVILEEVVKEIVAVAQVRRGLGVDKVRFL